jgi:hypothetical protein
MNQVALDSSGWPVLVKAGSVIHHPCHEIIPLFIGRDESIDFSHPGG